MIRDDNVCLVTSNDKKFETTQSVIGNLLSLTRVDIELPEIQSTDIAAVTRYKVIEAYQRLGQPVIVDDFGLYIEGLGDFPGPLVKHLIAETGVEGIQALESISSGRATMICNAAFFNGKRLAIFEGQVDGTFNFDQADPDADMLVDTVVVPSGYERAANKLDIKNHRTLAYEKMKDSLID
jgi:XTP/dITP diphosphohydrolase